MNQPQLFNPSEDFESEDDSQFNSKDLVAGITVTDTDWTTETVLNQIAKGNIYLDPSFQRREAWDDRRKSKFIESLILGIPVPQLVLAESKAGKGKFIVIDGKQRLLALMRFTGTNQSKLLKLRGLEIRSDLNDKTFETLKNDAFHHDDINAFENANIRTTVIRGWKEERALYLIFLRLNSGSVALSPQELRHALHPGKFIDFAVNFSENSTQLIKLLGKDDQPDFRMRDVELLIRFFGFKLFLKEYRGDLKNFLDHTVDSLNKTWTQRENEISAISKSFEEAIGFTKYIFGRDAFTKWTDDGYESRFNRAVFDIMCYYFSNNEVRSAILHRDLMDEIPKIFIELCTEKPNFVKSIESTTKSTTAVLTRLYEWGNRLERVTQVQTKELESVKILMSENDL